MEGEGDYYTDRYTVSTRMTPALRWAAMRAILMFHNCEGLSHKTVSTDHNFSRERRAEADSNRGPSAYLPNALPLGQTGSRILAGITMDLYIRVLPSSQPTSVRIRFGFPFSSKIVVSGHGLVCDFVPQNL